MNKEVIPYEPVDKFFAQTFHEYMKDYKRFSENFRLLMEGLPKDQQEFLVFTFSRILYIHNAQGYTMNDFTPEELYQQKDVYDNFSKNVVKEGEFYRYNDHVLPVDDLEASIFYYNMGLTKINDLKKVMGKDFIDAGVYTGDSTIILNKLMPRKIYAFEAISRFIDVIKTTLELNGITDKVVPLHLGLGSYCHQEEFAVHGGMSGSYYIKYFNDTDKNMIKEQVNIDTIDNFVEKNNLDVGLIKIDVEGNELEVLKGAEKTIRKFKPVILSAIYHNAEQFFEFKPTLDKWDLGYKFHFCKLNPTKFINEINVICEVY